MTKRFDDTVENLRVAMDNTDRAERLGEAASVELTLLKQPDALFPSKLKAHRLLPRRRRA